MTEQLKKNIFLKINITNKKDTIIITRGIFLMLISYIKFTVPDNFRPVFDSIDWGARQFSSFKKPTTPEVIKNERRELFSGQLKAGENIYLDRTELLIDSFRYDITPLKSCIKVQYHYSLVGSHTFENDPLICYKWKNTIN